jgi:subtilase family serine protease
VSNPRKWLISSGSILTVAVFALTATPALAAADAENTWNAHTTFHVRNEGKLPPDSTTPTGLSPAQVRAAYNLPSTGGTGTIAIIDAYDAPTILNDLTVFSQQYGLPLPNASNFEKHKMAGGITKNAGWALEISLDVEWAHAIAPNAKILLVEARSSRLSDLLNAVDYARGRSDVTAISMSWGGSEFSSESSYDSHFSKNGVAFFASSGDNGAGVSWPAVSPNVIGVGGTTLNMSGTTFVSETSWSGSGGGISVYVAEPDYQVTYGVSSGGMRAVPDVSYVADPNTGVSVYDSTSYQGTVGWFQVGGTSAGTPQWAAIQALGLGASNTNFYRDEKSSNPNDLRDITIGPRATVGYDTVTGLGSPQTYKY